MPPLGPHLRRQLSRLPRLVWLWVEYQAPLAICLETWVFLAIFGLRGEALSDFRRLYLVGIEIQENSAQGVLLFLQGPPLLQTVAMYLTVSLACHLRTRRHRARALARGLQGPLWAFRNRI